MDICEKIAYIKGLAEGLSVDGDSKEGKIILAIIDLLGDITDEICDIEDACDDMSEQIDAVDEDLASLEEIIYDDEEDGTCSGFGVLPAQRLSWIQRLRGLCHSGGV